MHSPNFLLICSALCIYFFKKKLLKIGPANQAKLVILCLPGPPLISCVLQLDTTEQEFVVISSFYRIVLFFARNH